ncbi:hypothetical protein D1012_10395 [Pseudotabrizicola alkalilacus]|uniref:ORC1/DEAH AAA+ ATPase domain-containing protein n=1 Tax=Pseudotabrizicola alkalilacus TaxID=2305252 RepID=A0A411Z1Y8_9RHOB|nr:hypothetical protein D1012_10395 [Pseudotabrizicola alkalilacus]
MTPELLKEVLEIIPSDRRTFSECFVFVDKAGRAKDEVFYAALLDRIQSSVVYCRSLELAFQKSPRDKERQRAPSVRIGKWLRNRFLSHGITFSEFADLTDDQIDEVFSVMSPLEAEIFHLMRRFSQVSNDEAHLSLPTALETTEQPQWMVLRDELRDALNMLDDADTEAAGQILDLANQLLSACADHERAAVSRNAVVLQTLREKLLTDLAAVEAFSGGVEFLAKVRTLDTRDALERLEGFVVSLVGAAAVLAEKVAAAHEATLLEQTARLNADCSRSELMAALDAAERAEGEEKAAHENFERLVQQTLDQLDVPISQELSAAIQLASDEERLPENAQDDPVDIYAALPPTTEREPEPQDDPLHATVPGAKNGLSEERQFEAEQPAAMAEKRTKLAAVFEDTSATLSVNISQPVEPEADEDPAAVWTGHKTLEDMLAVYLHDGELALAWHLADLAEEAGHVPPISPLLIRALAAGPTITGPYDQSTQGMGELLAAAMSGLDRAEQSGPSASRRARSIALAALMRPALLSRDTNARELLANLSLSGSLSDYAGVVNSLTSLRHDFQPSIAELTTLVGGEKKRLLPDVLASIQAWLPGARSARCMHAPSNTVLHKVLSLQGDMGALFEAVQKDDLLTIEERLDFLQGLVETKYVAEQLVAAEEKALNRPKGDAIRGMALDWICRKLREGAELILRWRTAKQEDGRVDDRRKEDLQRYMSNLRKELEQVSIESDCGDGLDAAVQASVDRAIREMLAILDGRHGTSAPARIPDTLELPLLRLPGECQPFAPDGAEYAKERAVQRKLLLSALTTSDAVALDEVSALRRHLADHAILPARKILSRVQRYGELSDAEIGMLQQELDEKHQEAVGAARSEIKSLRHDLEPLQSIDLTTSQQIQLWLDRLSAIADALVRKPEAGPALPMVDGLRTPDIPADFPQLSWVLQEGRTLRDSVRSRIIADQKGRLNRLIDRYTADGKLELVEQARQVIDNLNDRDLLTVEDIVVRLQNGQNPSLSDETKDDYFSQFYPDFVQALGALDQGGGKILPAIESGTKIGLLDFSQLDDSERKRSVQLFENWRALKNAMTPNRSDLGQSLRQFMERLGFTSVEVERETILSAQLRTMRMRCAELTAQRWFLPPAFGSEARGSYPIFLATSNIDDEQVTRELAKVGRDAPCILLVFGTLTKTRRENFALAMRRAKQSVLLIDEAQVLFLTTGTSWMERLISCAAPFGYLQPYTTSAGKIPTEMFFGREEEIEKIESATSDGCLVYGGRQLGKSALLHHVRKRFHQPATGRHAYYLKIDEFGGQVHSADQIWSLIKRELANDQILPKTALDADDIRDGVRDWLDKGGERRILLLIDEADMFLASEVRNGFPNLNRLKDMMENSARRFKVVFAGLHNVRRLAKAPNSPLVHLGDPICVGPMNTSSMSSLQARRLVTEPMRAAGFGYASPDLVQAVLTRVNYYPSLVQVFCKALLEGISSQARPRGQGPRWLLEKDNLFENNEDINSQIRERFQWTLNLDPRYELIAKVLALYRLDGVERDGGALAPEDVAHEVAGFWPRGFDMLPSEDFRAFLDEMVDLGVLIRQGNGVGTYGLRGAQVAQMLGQRDQLEYEILKIAEKEPRVDYDPSFYHRRARFDQLERRSPLSDSALAKLFDSKTPGLRFLVTAPGIWGGDAAQAIADLAEGWQDQNGLLSGALLHGSEDELRRHVERSSGRRVIVIPASNKVAPRWVSWLAERDQVSRHGNLIPIFVGGHEQIANLLPQRDSGVAIIKLVARPWEQNMLRAWLTEVGLQALDSLEFRGVLLDACGGSPVLLEKMRPQLEALVSGRRTESAEGAIREMGSGFSLRPAEIGLPESLVPEFCSAIELIADGAPERDVVDLLLAAGNTNAGADITLMCHLGLFQRPDPSDPDWLVCSAMGSLLFRTCERPAGDGRN